MSKPNPNLDDLTRLKIVIFGATGMVGSGVLTECLSDPRVTSVLLVGRAASGVTHPKVREIVREDLYRWDDARASLARLDACFFCIGVSAVGLDEPSYTRVTHDIPVAAAEALRTANPGIKFCFVSGEGADSSERGSVMWARIKGKTENRLLATAAIDAYIFRPGLIQPLKGARSRTSWYRWFYAITKPVFPVLIRLAPTHVTTTVNLGRAMIGVAIRGYPKRVLSSREINEVAARSAAS